MWTLELNSQTLSQSLATTTAALTKSDALLARQTKELATIKDLSEAQKSEIERLELQAEEAKGRQEVEMALMRREKAGMMREGSDLRATLESLRNERRRGVASLRREDSGLSHDLHEDGRDYLEDELAIKGRRKTGDGLEQISREDLFREYNKQFDAEEAMDDSFDADNSPAVRRHGASSLQPSASSEVERLSLALAHAESTIAQLQSHLSNGSPAPSQYQQSEAYSPRASLDLSENEWENSPDRSAYGGTPQRAFPSSARGRGGRGRGRGIRGGGSARAGSRLSIGGGDLSIGEAEEDEPESPSHTATHDAAQARSGSVSPGLFSHQFVATNYGDEDDTSFDDEEFDDRSENGSLIDSPRASNMLGGSGRRSQRNSLISKSNRPTSGMFGSSSPAGSPTPNSFVHIGGAAMTRNESAQTITSPSKLAVVELPMVERATDDELRRRNIVWKEMGIMTDFVAPILPPPPIVKETNETGAQTIVVEPIIVPTAELSVQTNPIPPPPPPPVVIPVVMKDKNVEARELIPKIILPPKKVMVERGILTDRINIPRAIPIPLPVPIPLPAPILVKKVLVDQATSTDPLPLPPVTKSIGVSTLPPPILPPAILRPTESRETSTSTDIEFARRGKGEMHVQTDAIIAPMSLVSSLSPELSSYATDESDAISGAEDDDPDATRRFYVPSANSRAEETDAGEETDFQDAQEEVGPLPIIGQRDSLGDATSESTCFCVRRNRY